MDKDFEKSLKALIARSKELAKQSEELFAQTEALLAQFRERKEQETGMRELTIQSPHKPH